MKRATVVAVAVIMGLAAIYLLFTIVFPWVDRTFMNDPVIESAVKPAIRVAEVPVRQASTLGALR